jgi:DNA repair exonuclease SbcCD ATPase subunit
MQLGQLQEDAEPNRTEMNYSDLIAAVRSIVQLNQRLVAVTEQRDRLAVLLSDIYNYAKGKKPHDYHNLPNSSDQITAKFDAWQEIESKIEELLQTTPTQTEPK